MGRVEAGGDHGHPLPRAAAPPTARSSHPAPLVPGNLVRQALTAQVGGPPVHAGALPGALLRVRGHGGAEALAVPSSVAGARVLDAGLVEGHGVHLGRGLHVPGSTLPSRGWALPCSPRGSGPRGRDPKELPGGVLRQCPPHLPPPTTAPDHCRQQRAVWVGCAPSLPGRYGRAWGSSHVSQRKYWASGHVSKGHTGWS